MAEKLSTPIVAPQSREETNFITVGNHTLLEKKNKDKLRKAMEAKQNQ